MGLSTTHLIIFLIIIVVIFGTKKLRNIGSDLGGAVKGFKDGMRDGTEKPAEAAPAPVQQVLRARSPKALEPREVVDRLEQRGLPRAVVSKQPDDLAGIDPEEGFNEFYRYDTRHKQTG